MRQRRRQYRKCFQKSLVKRREMRNSGKDNSLVKRACSKEINLRKRRKEKETKESKSVVKKVRTKEGM